MSVFERRKPGRPTGSYNKLAKAARDSALATGKLPHEILLDIARGLPVTIYRFDQSTQTYVARQEEVDTEMVIGAAKAGAPYFAPKISTVEVIQGISDESLNDIIERAAAEAGIGLGLDGEGEEEEGEGRPKEDAGDALPRRRGNSDPDEEAPTLRRRT